MHVFGLSMPAYGLCSRSSVHKRSSGQVDVCPLSLCDLAAVATGRWARVARPENQATLVLPGREGPAARGGMGSRREEVSQGRACGARKVAHVVAAGWWDAKGPYSEETEALNPYPRVVVGEFVGK